MSSTDLTPPTSALQVGQRRFAVAWRSMTQRRSFPVGVLDVADEHFHFRYLAAARQIPDFRPFLGFPELDEHYVSRRLWPFFLLRVMDRRRPDFGLYVERLGLPAAPPVLDILARSGGEMKGDNVFLAEEPTVDAIGRTECVFLVRGARYALRDPAAGGVARLSTGDPLLLEPEPTNPASQDALLVTTIDGTRVGWVPDLLSNYLRDALGRVTVVRNNGPDSPLHLRLLVSAVGQVGPAVGAFSGSGWPPRIAAST